MDNNDVKKRAEERRKKVMANAEARLKKIIDLTKADSTSNHPENGFIDFEVDSFVNEPSTGNGLKLNQVDTSSPLHNGHNPFLSVKSNKLKKLQDGGTLNNPMRQRQSMDFNRPVPALSNGFAFNRNDGLDPNNPFNMVRDLLSQSSPEEMNGITNVFSAFGSLFPQQPLQPAFRPSPSIMVFLVLGMATRTFLQFSTFQFNVFMPFLCLAVPLGIMSWDQRPTLMSSIISVVLLFFVGNPRTQNLINKCLRLTALLQGISSLFALYFFSFVLTHILFELSTINGDINQMFSKQLNPPSIFA